MTVAQGEQKLKALHDALNVGNLYQARDLLGELKAIVINFESLPPLGLETPTALQERVIARAMYEYAVLVSVKEGDQDSFQRYVSSLRPFYTGFSPEVSQSVMKNEIIGLNLLFLIVENRMADFHSELELLSESEQTHPAVAFCSRLDQLLMVGSYDQVMDAAAHPPCESFSFLLVKLLVTMRTNIGECAAAAYKTLTVDAATEILMCSSAQETLDFIQENYQHWTINAGVIDMCSVKLSKSEEIPATKLISQTLSYASELERIV